MKITIDKEADAAYIYFKEITERSSPDNRFKQFCKY